jgi:hypothetical protein
MNVFPREGVPGRHPVQRGKRKFIVEFDAADTALRVKEIRTVKGRITHKMIWSHHAALGVNTLQRRIIDMARATT